jgi:hypothetical protein
MAEMSVNALKNNLSNPQMSFLWEVIVPVPIGDGNSETFLLRAQSTSIPSREQGQIIIPFKQTAGIAVPGKLGYTHQWKCSFIEGEDAKVWGALYSWAQLIVDSTTGLGQGDAGIKTDIYLNLLSRGGEITKKLKLKGCYLMSLEDTPLSYADTKAIEYGATFSFDSIEDQSA